MDVSLLMKFATQQKGKDFKQISTQNKYIITNNDKSCEGRTGCYDKENNEECENWIGGQEGKRSDMNLGAKETRPNGKSLSLWWAQEKKKILNAGR